VFELVELDGKKRYDLVVIGGGSGGLACSKEGEYDYVCTIIIIVIIIVIHHLLLLRSSTTLIRKYTVIRNTNQ